MNLLSLQLGHNASIALYNKGLLGDVISQEKFDNIKNSSTFPQKAIIYALKRNKLKVVDKVLVSGLTVYPQQVSMTTEKPVSQPGITAKMRKNLVKFLFRHNRQMLYLIRDNLEKSVSKKAGKELRETLGKMGLNSDVEFVEHHLAHAYSPITFYGLWDTKEPVLVLTLDGSGDKYAATVNIWDGKEMKRISGTRWESSLGYIYSKATVYMGMKALEHEYKVMGIASYSKKDYFMKTYNKLFKGKMWVNKKDLTFESDEPTPYFDDFLVKNAAFERFDNLAAALQYFTEDLVLEWIRAAVKKTRISRIAVSGGVFMNVKLNKKIQELPEVKKVYFMPSCGDESNVIGCLGYYGHQKGEKVDMKGDMYLGMGFSNREVEQFIKSKKLRRKYKITKVKDIEEKVADLLSKNEVVALFRGRGEWGARALGNRTIVANP
ncbi:MAG: hypothetical protein JW727_03260 [Candidatus Aenigmarchaeota archaeon]|nr:hypothetical protein [Candidatus Aenigmarchaeota archaeon]